MIEPTANGHSKEGAELLKEYIRDVPDFPKQGITFKDITPLLGDGFAFLQAMSLFEERYRGKDINRVLAIEARGFIFGGALASMLGVGFVPVRKPPKLPRKTHTEAYQLEYGEGEVEIHQDALSAGEKVVIVDDVLATGGTALATAKLVERLGGQVLEYAFLVELDFLKGREKLSDYSIYSILRY